MTRVLRERLRHVRWLGGGSGAGKSTVAARLRARLGVPVYSTDEAMADHATRLAPGDAPELARFRAMTMDERWLLRPPEVMLETFHWFRGEGFDLVVDDLLAGGGAPAVVEGFRLLPALVAPLLTSPSQAVWLLPTRAFRWDAVVARGTAWDIPNRTSDPDRACRQLLERDALFTDHLRAETRRLGLPAIEVDVGLTEHDLVERVMRSLDPPSGTIT